MGDGGVTAPMTGFDDNDEIVREFLVESYENLDQLDQSLLELEKDPSNQEILAGIFRTVHTIKGTCGFLGFDKLERISHVGENLLSRLRDGDIQLDEARTSALLELIDAIRALLANIEEKGSEGEPDHETLLARLTELQSAGASVSAADQDAARSGSGSGGNEGKSVPCAQEAPEPPTQPPAEAPAVPESASPVKNIGDLLLEAGKIDDGDLQQALCLQHQGDPRHIGEILVSLGKLSPEDVTRSLRQQNAQRGGTLAECTIRVNVEHLDLLMDLVGELVLARNRLMQFAAGQGEKAISEATQRLNLVTLELQEGVMKTRMQPIGTVWNKLPRVVRDLAQGCGKKARIVMEGDETELDRTIIEAIRDPLTHLVRNCVDHGIEAPPEREAAGKPAQGTILLRAYHEGGHVNLEITDDGKGIDGERLRARALEKGLIGGEAAARLSQRETQNLIFLPGLSTATQVTRVSGRGVGMDVVKTNIERIGGKIELLSSPGRGTTVHVRIPLTLAIIPALIVRCRGRRYAIPQVSLVELVRLDLSAGGQAVEFVHESPVYRLRDRLLPLVRLDDLFGERSPEAESQPASGRAETIVVLQVGHQTFGLITDEVLDTEEIVVKPLGPQVRHIPCFAGATIMGDGSVALILDVAGLAGLAGVHQETAGALVGDADDSTPDGTSVRQSLLVFSAGGGRRMAVPLELVRRLEEFPAERIEHAAGRAVVQYRGTILPLVGPEAGPCRLDTGGAVQSVVFCLDGRHVGLVVDEIIDVVREALCIEKSADLPSELLGTAVVSGKVTELIDVRTLIQSRIPGFFAERSADESAAAEVCR